jgi:hypothetical protein
MSIAAVIGYSTMYAVQKQGTPDGPLSLFVTPIPFRAATYGKIAPSSLAELEQYSAEADFDTSQIDNADWDVAWPPVCWTKVGGKYYTWSGAGWDSAALTDGTVIPTDTEGLPPGLPADELLFVGRYPQTKTELNTLTPDPSTAFTAGQYVCLVEQGSDKQYHWDGDAWVSGVTPS